MSFRIIITQLLLILTFLCVNTTLNAQQQEEVKHRCYTMEHRELHQPQDQLRSMSPEDFEGWFRKWKKGQEARSSRMPTLYTLPIVFHVIHNGEAVGTGSNLSQFLIDEQLVQLNYDFRRVAGTSGHNSNPVGADTEIEFCPAALDNNGAPMLEPAINRIDRNTMGFNAPPYSTGYIDGTIKPATIWNPNEYLNIWICDISGGILGYAQFPETDLPGMSTAPQNPNTDGNVLDYQTIGSMLNPNPAGGSYAGGRTLSHEVGHWLGLRHIWGDGGCSVDDFCNDTPTSDAANRGCPVTTSCSSVDMVENYMDYTDDFCMNIFTIDQKGRMQYVMGDTGNGSVRREILATSTKCETDPYIQFASSGSMLEEGTSSCATAGIQTHTIDMIITAAPSATATVSLFMTGTATNNDDYSIFPTTLSFPAGSTAAQTITISITEDAYIESDETLELSFTVNPNGGDALAGSNNMTHVLEIGNDDLDPNTGGTATTVLFTENFQSNSWTQTSSGNNDFVYGTTPGISGRSPYISSNGSSHFYTNSSSNAQLVSPAINATGYSNITVNFDYICDGENTNGTFYDYGRLEYSTNGSTFTSVGPVLQNEDFATNLNVTLPSAADNVSTLYIAFRWINDNSVRNQPPLAFDNVQVSGDLAVATDVQTDVNSGSGYAEHDLGPNETVHFFDQNSNNVMMTIENLSSHNYGCTKVEVDRMGTGAAGTNAIDVEEVTDKSFLVTPEFNNASGNYRITVYYSDAEITGWVGGNIGGDPLTELKMVKSAGPITGTNTLEIATATTFAAFNTVDYAFSADYNTGFSGFALGDESVGLRARAKTLLQGPYDSGSNLLNDDLRTLGLIPDLEPYTALGYTHVGGGNEMILDPAVLNVTGHDAIVDWVMLELRDADDATQVVGTRSALLQRDGDIVDINGTSLVAFYNISIGSYFLSIRHRNHLGVMTGISLNFDEAGTNLVDFSDSATPIYGTNALKDVNGTMVMWSGNGDNDGQIVYTGSGTDINPISIGVFTNPLNVNFSPSFPLDGYETADYNMDGQVIYTGSGTDVNNVSISVFTNPANGAFSPSFPVEEQLPD